MKKRSGPRTQRSVGLLEGSQTNLPSLLLWENGVMDQVSIRVLRSLTLKRHLELLPEYFYGEIGAASNSDTLGESLLPG